MSKAFRELGLENTSERYANEQEGLRQADFLFLVLTESEQADAPALRKTWEFFENEIRWGRKKHGEILFFVPDESVLGKLPLRLKKYGYYLLGEEDDAAEYCRDAIAAADEQEDKAREAMPAVKQIRYSPPEETVRQIEFSVRAPSVPSFDGSKSRQGERNADACRRDHVFDDLSDNVPQKQQLKTKKGCAIAFAVFLLLAAVVAAVVLMAVGFSSAAARVLPFVAENATYMLCLPRGGACAYAANALQAALACGII